MIKRFRSGFAVGLFIVLTAASCKSNTRSPEPIKTDTTNRIGIPPAIPDNTKLESDVRDVLKDYPHVSATVLNGEVTLTGGIEKDRLPVLMQSVQGLNPKKVNNRLIVDTN